MRKIRDIVEEVDFPEHHCFFNLLPDTCYNYVSSTYCDGLVNYIDQINAYLVNQYEDTATVKSQIEAAKNLPVFGNDSWFHTKFSRFFDDNILVTGRIGEDGDYCAIFYDQDVSCCCIWRLAKEHYATLKEFNQAMIDEMRIWPATRDVFELREPQGWIGF